MRSVLTPDDMRKGEAIPPGWYPMEITSYSEEVTKGSDLKPSDGSMNAIFIFKILDGPSHLKGRELKRYFNEKALGFGKNLWILFFPTFNKEKGGELTTEMFRSLVGKKCQGYVKKNTAGFDNVEDFRPFDSK